MSEFIDQVMTVRSYSPLVIEPCTTSGFEVGDRVEFYKDYLSKPYFETVITEITSGTSSEKGAIVLKDNYRWPKMGDFIVSRYSNSRTKS